MLHRHRPKLTPGLGPDLGLRGIRKLDILGPSFKRIQAAGKCWIFMWCVRDMAKWLLQVLRSLQALWGPSTARNLWDVSHWGGAVLPHKMPSAGTRSDTELIYWDTSSTEILRSTWWPLKLPFWWSQGQKSRHCFQLLHEDFCTMVERSHSQQRVYGKWKIAPTGHCNLNFWVPAINL